MNSAKNTSFRVLGRRTERLQISAPSSVGLRGRELPSETRGKRDLSAECAKIVATPCIETAENDPRDTLVRHLPGGPGRRSTGGDSGDRKSGGDVRVGNPGITTAIFPGGHELFVPRGECVPRP